MEAREERTVGTCVRRMKERKFVSCPSAELRRAKIKRPTTVSLRRSKRKRSKGYSKRKKVLARRHGAPGEKNEEKERKWSMGGSAISSSLWLK